MDISNLKCFKDIKDRIKSSYSCNQERCPKMRDRLDRHVKEHHSSFGQFNTLDSGTQGERVKKDVVACGTHDEQHTVLVPSYFDARHEETTISPRQSSTESETETCQKFCVSFSNSVQSDFVAADLISSIYNLKTVGSVPIINHNYEGNSAQTNFNDNTSDSGKYDKYTESFKLKDLNDVVEKTKSQSNYNSHESIVLERKETVEVLSLKNGIKSINEHVNEHIYRHNMNIRSDNEQSTTHKSKNILKNEIKNWLAKIEWKDYQTKDMTPAEQIVDRFLNRLSRLLDKPNNSKMYKLTLEGVIVELLLDLPIHFNNSKYKMIHINKLAEELANRLLYILRQDTRHNTHDTIQNIILQKAANEIISFRPNDVDKKTKFIKVIKNVLNTNDIQSNVEMEDLIVETIIENIYSIKFRDRNDLEDVINSIICKYTNVTELQAVELANIILMDIKSIAEKEVVNHKPSIMFIQPRLSGVISVYNTEEKFKMFTSTPKKKKKPDEEIPKLNPEQISYMEKLSAVVRDWMKSLPIHFHRTEDAIFKDTIISDLAGNLMYAIRYDQIVVGLKKSDNRFVVKDKESTLKDIIFLWLNRYGIFDDRQICAKEIEDLYSKVDKIPVPVLNRPQHGTRQTIAKTAWLEGEDYYDDYEYIPKGIHILEDISMWMNEQSDIFVYEDPSMRGKMVKALAGDIQERLVSKHTDKEIMDDISCWLNEVVKPENKKDIPDLIEELKNRIKDIPQDITLGRRYVEKIYEIYHKWLATQNPESNESVTFDEDFLDPNGTMKEYIGKFIQKNCDTDDPTVRKVFAYTLKKELLKLSPDARKDVYNNSSQIRNNQVFSIEKFANELEYIKILSDWLNTLPIDSSYKVLRNKHRIEFIQNLAKYIVEIEDERAKLPNAMDYDAYLMSIIASNAVYLSLTNEQKIYMLQTASSLLRKLEDYRKRPIKSYKKLAINTEDLGIFIEEFVKEYGQDVVDDALKLEVWMDRLTQEVQNIARETADPMLLEKTQIYNKLAQVAHPGEDSVALFGLQLEYATEIMDWLKNLPLKKDLNESEEQLLVSMISDLADRIIDRQIKKLDNTNNIQEDKEIVEFIENWISKLPLETQDEIVIPIVIQQLMNRIDRANKSQGSKTVDDIIQTTEKVYQITDKIVKTKSPDKSKMYKSNPENAIFEAVEKFCKSLPIQTNDKDLAKATKDEIAKKLLQKISKLNIDPTIFNDELLFKEMFRDEVDMILENMPQTDPQKNVEKLKNTLIDSIVELENVIKEQSAGEDYKQKLKNTIEASIPNPVQMNQIYDPGFEFYKDRLATMFILQNFDHADEDIKLKYEKRIQSEVDKYFEYAQNRNAIPLSKDRIQNELYSVLFKVPIPNEASIVGEVEEAKTRFEIDAWYELLPLIPTNNLDELLEREKILSTLAKRIHDLEKLEKNGDPVINKEIIKWLSKLPILPGYSRNIIEFANQLQKRLKSTSYERKRILKETQRVKGKGKSREKRKSDKNLEESKLRTHNAKKQSASVEKPRLSPRTHTQIPVVAQKPAAELILEAVETWCSQLPLPTSDPREAANSRSIKDNLAINIVLKISELNGDPQVFANEYEYDMKLDQEIDKLTYNLPLLCNFQNKEARKLQLKEMIRSIKPLIALQREKHEYKEHLKHTVRSLLEEPHIADQSNKVKPSKDVEKIVDNFIEYNCSKDDVEERNVHKIKVHNAVVKHLSDIKEKTHKESVVDPLIIRNEFICEMSKVPPPGEAVLQDLVEEIRMKNEVNDFFQELGFPKEDEKATLLRNEMREQLANKLFDLEKNGHNIANEINMKKEIDKFLTKLGKTVSPEIIDAFVKKLRHTEVSRKATPLVPSIPKDILPSSPNLQQTLPPMRRSVADAHKVLTPKPTVSFQPSYPRYDPRRISKQNELISRSRIIPPHELVMKNASICTPANNQKLGSVNHPSMNQNAPTRLKPNSVIGKSSIIQEPASSAVPVEIVQPEIQQSSPFRQVVISQQIRSPISAVVQPPSSNNLVPGPPVRLTQTAPSTVPVQANAGSTPSAPISAPSTILPTRPIADPSVRDTRPTQAPQSRVPSQRRRDPESELPDERDKGCKCGLRNRVRKRKRVCIRDRDFCDDFDYRIPPPLMWCGMGQPFIVFY